MSENIGTQTWQDVLDGYEAEVRALPLGHEIQWKGCSTFNWRMSVLADIRERFRALAAWHPIGTAPKDGTLILSFGPGGHVIIHWMHEGFFEDNAPACWFPVSDPTHWMPLPALPAHTPSIEQASS